MNQSTFSAQVANNLLTLLQGYTKGIRFIALLTMLCTVGVGQMWGAEETIKWDSYTSSGSGSTLTITWDGNNSCTITQSKGDNTNNNVSTSYATSPRWYQYHHVTFTPKTGCTITQVVLLVAVVRIMVKICLLSQVLVLFLNLVMPQRLPVHGIPHLN